MESLQLMGRSTPTRLPGTPASTLRHERWKYRAVPTATTAPELSLRALNRALMRRQLLDARSPMPIADALEYLVGLQAQAPGPPYVALWSRLQDFDPSALGQMLLDREAVRIALMRSTIHLVTARDALYLRPLLQPVLDRAVGGYYKRNLHGADPNKIAEAGRKLVEDEPLTLNAIGTALAKRWRRRDPHALAQAVRARVPLVQVTPRGVWGASGAAAHTSIEAWLGRGLDPEPDPKDMLLRYLRAFGPASILDVQTWSGLTRLREPIEAMRTKLRSFRGPGGTELLDVPDGDLPDPDVPLPARFLGEFDNLLLSHSDRSRVISEEHRKRIATRNGMVPGAVLVDGWFAGIWRLERRGARRVLVVEAYRRLSKREAADVTEEAGSLYEMLAPGLGHEIEMKNG